MSCSCWLMFNERNLSLLMLFMNLPLCWLLNLPLLPCRCHCPLALSLSCSLLFPLVLSLYSNPCGHCARIAARIDTRASTRAFCRRISNWWSCDGTSRTGKGVVLGVVCHPSTAGVNCVIAECCFPMFNWKGVSLTVVIVVVAAAASGGSFLDLPFRGYTRIPLQIQCQCCFACSLI